MIADRERAIEALIFASETPLSTAQLQTLVGADHDMREMLAAIAARYVGAGINLVRFGDRWHFQTAPDLAHLLRETRHVARKLSRAATETLAIIAYHEPVSRADIESIRGVQISKGTVDVLIEAGWIAPAGRRPVPGRPLIYATTPAFLTHFGLNDRRDLPGIADLQAAGLLDPLARDDFAGELETDDEDA